MRRRKDELCYDARMEEGRKRVIGIMAAILTSIHMRTADDLFGTPQGSPRTDKLIAASVRWAGRIMGMEAKNGDRDALRPRQEAAEPSGEAPLLFSRHSLENGQ